MLHMSPFVRKILHTCPSGLNEQGVLVCTPFFHLSAPLPSIVACLSGFGTVDINTKNTRDVKINTKLNAKSCLSRVGCFSQSCVNPDISSPRHILRRRPAVQCPKHNKFCAYSHKTKKKSTHFFLRLVADFARLGRPSPALARDTAVWHKRHASTHNSLSKANQTYI